MYVRIVAPGVIFMGWSLDYIFFAQLQGKPIINVLVLGMASLVQLLLSWVLAIQLDWKMEGIAIATTANFVTRFVVAVIYVHSDSHLRKSVIPLFSCETLRDLKFVWVQGYNSLMLRVMSWWTFDIYMMIAALLH